MARANVGDDVGVPTSQRQLARCDDPDVSFAQLAAVNTYWLRMSLNRRGAKALLHCLQNKKSVRRVRRLTLFPFAI